MKITIGDIANMAEVSKSTVSRHLNNGYVSEENKNKINKIIEETGYRSNFFAKRLKSKKSYLIGVVIPRMESFASNSMLIGIEAELERSKYEMFISISNLKVEKELDFIEKFNLKGVDGIIVLTTEITKKHYELIEKLSIPVLFLGQIYEGLHSMAIDDRYAGKIMGNYIKSMGHRDIVYLGVDERDKAVGRDRKEGFMESFKDENINIKFIETDFSHENAYRIGKDTMQYNPTAIVCTTDNIAIGTIRYLNENKIDVPGDVSVCGFGNYHISDAIYPSLTTLDIDYKYLGKLAAKNINDLIDNKNMDEDYTIDIKLIERQSVKKID